MIEEIAQAVGIVEINGMNIDGFEGALMTNAEKTRGTIIFSKDSIPSRQRFTIAHELGHFLIPWHKGDTRCTRDDMLARKVSSTESKKEVEANRFAAGMLMPKPMFLADMERLGEADVCHILTLAQKYETSVAATISRYIDLTDDLCAFVFSQNNVVRYFRATPKFPRLSIHPKGPIPSQSITAQMPANKVREPSAWIEMDGGLWLEEDWGKQSPAVMEQSIRQADGHQITLLMIDKEQFADDDDEEHQSLSWR